MTSALVTVSPSGELVADPLNKDLKEALSVHALAFSSHGDLLLAESEGNFSIDVWEQVFDRAEHICHGSSKDEEAAEDVSMEIDEATNLGASLRAVIHDKVTNDQRWKNNSV